MFDKKIKKFKKKIGKKALKVLVISSIVILITCIFFAGIVVGKRGYLIDRMQAATGMIFLEDQPQTVDFDPVWKAWRILDEKFVAAAESSTTTVAERHTTDQDKVWGLIRGLAASYEDPYTTFFPPSEAKMFNDEISGSFEGVGMEISIRDNILTVVSPLKGTPAFRAGMKPADRVLKIDGEETKGMTLNIAVRKIRGPKGSEVVLTVLREGEAELIDIPVVRDVIKIPTIETEKKGDVFIISLFNFSAESDELFRQALVKFSKSGTDKLILDLRGNPGGYLQSAVGMASWFLPEGKVVVTEDYGKKDDKTVHRTRKGNVFSKKLRMAILINRGSASASEILAGALHDYEIAKLVGTRSFGKGSVQQLIDITPETSLKVTVARWLLPLGESINKDGIEPDFLVELTDEEKKEAKENPKKDWILEEALRLFKDGKI